MILYQNFWYWLNSNILVSWKEIIILQKSFFSDTLLCNSSLIFVLKGWIQFKQQKSQWSFDVNNAENYFAAR